MGATSTAASLKMLEIHHTREHLDDVLRLAQAQMISLMLATRIAD